MTSKRVAILGDEFQLFCDADAEKRLCWQIHVLKKVTALPSDAIVAVFGEALGVGRWAHESASTSGRITVLFELPRRDNPLSRRDEFERAWRLDAESASEVLIRHASHSPFQARNEALASFADELLVFSEGQRAGGSGAAEWSEVVDLFKKAGKPVDIISEAPKIVLQDASDPIEPQATPQEQRWSDRFERAEVRTVTFGPTHFSGVSSPGRFVFSAACGASEPNQRSTPVPEHVDCPECLKFLEREGGAARFSLLPQSQSSPLDAFDGCKHEETRRGEDAPLPHGSYRTEVCTKCGAFRTHGHCDEHAPTHQPWRPQSEYAKAISPREEW